MIHKGVAITNAHTEIPARPGITPRHLGPGAPSLQTKQFWNASRERNFEWNPAYWRSDTAWVVPTAKGRRGKTLVQDNDDRWHGEWGNESKTVLATRQILSPQTGHTGGSCKRTFRGPGLRGWGFSSKLRGRDGQSVNYTDLQNFTFFF